MTSDNLYHRYEDEFSFDFVCEKVNSLPSIIPHQLNETEKSILEDVSIDTLQRKGLHTYWDYKLARYSYKRPELTVQLLGKYKSDGDLCVSIIRVFNDDFTYLLEVNPDTSIHKLEYQEKN